MPIKFKFITPDDREYAHECMLRYEILRKPLGMPPGSELFPEEKTSLHLIAINKKEVVGCVLFFPENENSGRLYQMAVSEEYQGKGFGRKLISTLEQAVEKLGIKTIHLYAREETVGFYLELGYHPVGSLVEKMEVMHQPMEKTLSSQ
jgi:N-acetylglutamate synthase-like GNAT family acetyltransferase